MLLTRILISVAVAITLLLSASAQETVPRVNDRLPPPPFAAKYFPGWFPEHVAFRMAGTGKPVGGPARWAIDGSEPHPQVFFPTEQHGKLYLGNPDSDVRLFVADYRRRIWKIEAGEAWPIAGSGDLGELDGPGSHATFLYTGVYGGFPQGGVAVGNMVYLLDNGWLRKVEKGKDGAWTVTTVAGKGTKKLISGAPGKLVDVGQISKGMATDAKGNLYLTLLGGLIKADNKGDFTWVITGEQVRKDMAQIYAQKWPDAKIRSFGLGEGEGVGLQMGPDGTVYGGGRTWPSNWKVTPSGKFVPLVNYAPKEAMLGFGWGKGDPASYEPHCSFGWGVTPEGYIWHQNEIPYVRTRYEFDKNQVTVWQKDGAWGLDKKSALVWPEGNGQNAPDGSIISAGNGTYPLIRFRKEK